MSRSYLRSKWMRKKNDEYLYAYKTKGGVRNIHRLDEMPKNNPTKYITLHGGSNANWLQEPSNFCAHKPHKNGHRMVSGIVRANVKREIRRDIEQQMNES